MAEKGKAYYWILHKITWQDRGLQEKKNKARIWFTEKKDSIKIKSKNLLNVMWKDKTKGLQAQVNKVKN